MTEPTSPTGESPAPDAASADSAQDDTPLSPAAPPPETVDWWGEVRGLGLMLLFVLAQALFLSRYIKDTDNAKDPLA